MKRTGRYQGAQGLRAAAEDLMTGRNDKKFVVCEEASGLYLLIEDGKDSYVQGDRDDATGFDTREEAIATARRFGLSSAKGFRIKGPTK